MFVGFAEGHEEAAALETSVILSCSAGRVFETKIRGLSYVFADVVGGMSG